MSMALSPYKVFNMSDIFIFVFCFSWAWLLWKLLDTRSTIR